MALASSTILLLYCLFAGISIAVNIGTQILSMALYAGQFAIEISIFLGTLAGLPIRYYLDKRFIFVYQVENVKHEGKVFLLYGAMSVITTLIFWSMEFGFHLAFNDTTMRYLGGMLGLAIGFYIKYQLDKRFVFVHPIRKWSTQ